MNHYQLFIFMKKNLFLPAIIVALLISSCGQTLTVTKKYHSFGWNIAFEGNGKKGETTETEVSKRKAKTVITEINEKTEEAVLVNNDIQKEAIQSNSSSVVKSNSNVIVESKIVEVKNSVSTSKTNDQTAKLNVSKKQIKKAIKNKVLDKDATNDADILLYVLLILLVPVLGAIIAMFLYEGAWTMRVTITLILAILFWMPAIIYSLYIILTGQ